MKGIFRLQAEFEKAMSSYTPSQWLRGAAWWFVRGRAGMEAIIRSRPRSADGQAPHNQLLTQPHVDLAKAWWIMADVIPAHHSLAPSSESYSDRAATATDATLAEFFDSCDVLNSSLRALLSSMNRNHVMPPDSALIQGQDQTIWVQYPPFAPDILPILSGGKRSLTESAAVRIFDPLSLMAIGDTKKDFSYYRWFVNATISADDQAEQISFQCLFSVMRARNDWHPKVGICSQKELVSLCITGERKYGPSWEDVKWSELDSSLQVKLPHGYTLNAQLAEQDYHLLVSMNKKAFTVQTSLFPRDDERLLFEVPLETFQYTDNMRPPAFPLERMRRCRVRLFGISEQRAEGRGTRRFYRGMRILVVTSPKNRQLADVSHEIGLQHPILIEMLTENAANESFPAMTMFITEDKRQCSLFMVFSQLQDRQMLYSALNESDLANNEMQYSSSRLKKLSIEPVLESEAHSKAAQNPLGRVQWQEVVVVNKDPMNPDDDFGQTVLSDSLRIVAQGAGGTVTDRINLGPGEFKLRLPADGSPALSMLRPPQDDLSTTFDRRVAPFTPDQVEDLHRAVSFQPTKRTYAFSTLEDLHGFQAALTSFNVKYDGLARDFTISRRRPVTALSKHKRLEAGVTRVQVVSHDKDKVVQLLAFFDDSFSYAEAIGFVLKGMDVFERYDGKHHGGKGKFGVRLVDAKFSLPRLEKTKGGQRPEDLERPFICLDMPEFPGENDDIWIGFDDEDGKWRPF
jgi:hypothetical protein